MEDPASVVNQVCRGKCSNLGTQSTRSKQCNYWHTANLHSRYPTVFPKYFTGKGRGGVLGPCILGTKSNSVEVSSSKLKLFSSLFLLVCKAQGYLINRSGTIFFPKE